MGQIAGITDRLLDAFVEVVEPVFGRFVSKRRIVAREEEGGLAFYAVRRGRVETLVPAGAADDRDRKRLKRARGAAVELRLAPARILGRPLNLPAAGRDYLEPIIEHRLERLTPWRPDKVLFGYAASGGEAAADGTITVDFSATSADLVAPAVARLEALDLAPTALGSAAEPLESPLRIDLYRGRRDVGRRRLRRGVGLAIILAYALALPALGAVAYLGAGAEARLADLDKRLATKRAVLLAATGSGAEGRDKDLIGEKTKETAVVVLIDRLSAAIPDDTYLRELSVEGEKVRVAGISGNAPALISLLDADPGLSGVRFAAPVTRTDDGRDSFDIVATWDDRVPGAARTASAGTSAGESVP